MLARIGCLQVLQQFGFVLCAASFLDCFVVRPFMVPALMLVLEQYNWWPVRMPPVTEVMVSDESNEPASDHL